MATKTFYPVFHEVCQHLNRLIAEHGPAMVQRTNLIGASDANGVLYTTTLTNLTNALGEIVTAWPPYLEPQ